MSKLVKFSNGKYGVYIGLGLYRDLTLPAYKWSKYNLYFKDCMGTEEEARLYFPQYQPHTVVEDNSIIARFKLALGIIGRKP